uniref:Uncharacterized protein n=1 Tax=Timema shepardi TaxID=629360 RepID=A0A7R9AVB7_TIMSH|nr:unnamed protein product [Timema shepardi]
MSKSLDLAESLRDKAMKYYSECQAEKAQASASKPSLSSFGSKGSSMGSMGTFRIDECPKDEETKCDLGCVLKKLGAIKDNKLMATTTKDMCEAKDPAKKKKLNDAIDACAKKVGTQKNECEAGAAVCKCIMEWMATFPFPIWGRQWRQYYPLTRRNPSRLSQWSAAVTKIIIESTAELVVVENPQHTDSDSGRGNSSSTVSRVESQDRRAANSTRETPHGIHRVLSFILTSNDPGGPTHHTTPCQPHMHSNDQRRGCRCGHIPTELPSVNTTADPSGIPGMNHELTPGPSWETCLPGTSLSWSAIPRDFSLLPRTQSFKRGYKSGIKESLETQSEET